MQAVINNDLERCLSLVEIGDTLIKSSKYETALQYYLKALNDLTRLHARETDQLLIETTIKFVQIFPDYMEHSDTDQTVSILKEAISRANFLNNLPSLALLKIHQADIEISRDRHKAAKRVFDEAWSIAQSTNSPSLKRSAGFFKTYFLASEGRFRDAVEMYEETVPDVEELSQNRLPLRTMTLVASCYKCLGQVSQGLGMMNALLRYCRELGKLFYSCRVRFQIGEALLDIRQVEESINILEIAKEETLQGENLRARLNCTLYLACAYYLRNDFTRSTQTLREYIDLCNRTRIRAWYTDAWMVLCLAMEEGKLSRIEGFCLEKEIKHLIGVNNVYGKGLGYKYQAIYQKRNSECPEEVIKSYGHAVKWLEKSGHVIRLAQVRAELAREYLSIGKESKAVDLAMKAYTVLFPINKDLFPEDLKKLVHDQSHDGHLLGEILKFGREFVTIRDTKMLVQNILSSVNRVTGAERGALFLLNEGGTSGNLSLRASKNITLEDIERTEFNHSMKLIEKTAATGQGNIMKNGSANNSALNSGHSILSSICMPLILRDKVIGVLYHDNQLFHSYFKDSDFEILSYFAAQAAIALDNAQAYEEIQALNKTLSEEKEYYKEQHLGDIQFKDFIGNSPAIKRVFAQIQKVSGTDATVLIQGDTGVGKEVVARTIHSASLRCNKPFIRVDLSTLAESLMVSELFGHEKGAFTGAATRRVGRFELADKGTIFLDEIGNMSIEVQARLLRVLQSGEFERIGGMETIRSDFRILAATNRDLRKEVRAGRFREDLFFRLNVFPVLVPPLRDRKDDIPALAHYFLDMHTKKMGKFIKKIPQVELDKLQEYNWPGNVRELENIIERGVILGSGNSISLPELGVDVQDNLSTRKGITLEDNERLHILWALEQTNGKVYGLGGASELLDIHHNTLYSRMKKLGIRRKSPVFHSR